MTGEVWAQRRTSFGSAAEDYAAARPRYPRETLAWSLPGAARTVLDLAAGTGIITRDLLELGVEDVIAVEPLAEMRAAVPAAARAIEGSAEAIPLPDASVDAILVGQAWHWFDAAKATAECHRVLRPGGRLTLLWNLYDDADPTTAVFMSIVDAEEERLDRTEDPVPLAPVNDPGRFSPGERSLVEHAQTYDIDRVVRLAMSRSQAIMLDEAGRRALADRLRQAMPAGELALHWVCEAWRATAL